MKIASVHLQSFKRFHDLIIQNLPPAKLVVLTGPNGCGKSSVFDGLLTWRLQSGQLRGFDWSDPYYAREAGKPTNQATITWHGTGPATPEETGNATDVRTDRLAIMASLKKIAKGVSIIPLIDRDDHSALDVIDLEATGYGVLGRRQIESYLFDDEVLDALCENLGRPGEKAAVRQIKADALAASVQRGNLGDDVKKAAGEIVQKIRQKFQLTGMGNDTESFERNVLCPLIKPDLNLYAELRQAIFKA
jgi:hypothetical protein